MAVAARIAQPAGFVVKNVQSPLAAAPIEAVKAFVATVAVPSAVAKEDVASAVAISSVPKPLAANICSNCACVSPFVAAAVMILSVLTDFSAVPIFNNPSCDDPNSFNRVEKVPMDFSDF